QVPRPGAAGPDRTTAGRTTRRFARRRAPATGDVLPHRRTIAEMDPLPCVYRVQGRAGVSPVTVVAYRDGEYLLAGAQQHKVSRRHRPRSLVLASTSGL